MNKAIILAVMELKSKLLNGIISERLFQKELDNLLQTTDDEKTKEFINQHKDLDV